MVKFLIATTIIFFVLVGWLYVEDLYRRFSRRHPELGPYRQDGGGCGDGCCSCSNGSCSNTSRN